MRPSRSRSPNVQPRPARRRELGRVPKGVHLLAVIVLSWAMAASPAVAQLGFGDAPAGLVAMPLSQFQVELEWQDRSRVEEGFQVQKRSPGQDFEDVVAILPADTQRVTVGDLTPGLPYEFRVRAVREGFGSPWVSAHATPPDFLPCDRDRRSLCLLEDRFRVQLHWADPFNGGNGKGRPLGFEGSDESGVFWFFDDANVELVVKVLDARSMGSGFWVFHGALTAVEYWVTVTDQTDFSSRTYYNPPREQCGLADTDAFPVPWGPPEFAGPTAEDDLRTGPSGPERAAASSAPVMPGEPGLGALVPFSAAGDIASGTCVPTDTDLCLQDGRFRVQVDWRDPRSGSRGTGLALPGSVAGVPADTTGFFWFFDGGNVELAVKMIDGTGVNGFFWFFFGGLTDVEYTVTVTDTVEGTSESYFSAAGDICGGLDVRAFGGGGGTP